MFSDDRFMTMATGLVLAIAVGAMAQNSGSLMAFFTGETVTAGQDDQFMVRAGTDMNLDVLANDTASGTVVLLDTPICGSVRTDADGMIEYFDSAACSGDVTFSYCVEAEGECEPYRVALNVINVREEESAVVTASQVLTPIEPVAVIEPVTVIEPVADVVVTMQATDVEEILPVEDVNTDTAVQVASTRTNVQGDRQTPGQILLEDDSSDVVVAGFNSGRAPSLFAPSMNELIQPQESVAIFRRDTEVLSPTTIERDQNIQTQTSAATPTGSSINTNPMQSDVTLGTESSPMIAFAAPSQPSLMRSPQLASVSADILTLGPEVDSAPALGATDLAEAGPEVDSTIPSVFTTQEGEENIRVASLFDTSISNDRAPSNILADALAAVSPSDEANLVDVETASTGPVSIHATDPADSSDIVVEMAAQILLPIIQFNNELSREPNGASEFDILLTDKMFSVVPDNADSTSSSNVVVAAVSDAVPALPGNTVIANARCDVQMSSSARPGAAISVFVASPCRAGEVLTLSHADFSFSTRLDDRGTLSVTIPAFTTVAELNVEFDDGGTAESRVIVRDAEDMDRLAVIWAIPVDLDIHAYEGGAADDSKGHVWSQNPRAYRDTLTGGGGYLETFGDSSIIGGTMAEVYSIPTSRIRRETTISMDLRVNNIGIYCGNSMILRTVRVDNHGEVSKREFNLSLPDCERSAGGLVIEKFVAPISVARR